MPRSQGVLHLKAAATELLLDGQRYRLISLQNIETELSAQEIAAWQIVMRVMAHEAMNSLTPISSLSATASDLVQEALRDLLAGDGRTSAPGDAANALEVVMRRSEDLRRFVGGHRRLTAPLSAQITRHSVRRIFARMRHLFAAEMEERHIAFAAVVEPEMLEVDADGGLLDQALVNLMRTVRE